MPTQNEKLLAAAGHLAYLVGLPLIFPLVLFLWQRDQSRFVAEQAKQAIILHLTALFLILLGVGFSIGTFGVGAFAVIPTLSFLGFVAVVLTVVAVLKVAEGRHYRYPIIGGLLDWA